MLWRNLLTSSSSGVLALFFFLEISFYASFEAYSYTFSLHRQWACGRQHANSLAQTREEHRYTDHKF